MENRVWLKESQGVSVSVFVLQRVVERVSERDRVCFEQERHT